MHYLRKESAVSVVAALDTHNIDYLFSRFFSVLLDVELVMTALNSHCSSYPCVQTICECHVEALIGNDWVGNCGRHRGSGFN